MQSKIFSLFAILCIQFTVIQGSDLLSSWNENSNKQAIIHFVESVTNKEGESFVPPAERVAVFDNDGTLWSEQPIYFQLSFALDRIKSLAPQHPEWKNEEPFKSAIKGDIKSVMAGGGKAMLELLTIAQTGITEAEFNEHVVNWISTAKHPKTGKLYSEMVFQPMLELLTYLRENGFKTYIVSGGGIEFMRPWTEAVYGIPPEQVIGSSFKTEFNIRNGVPVIDRLTGVNFINDKSGKPVAINRHIGRRPIAAFGNSDGDLQMLQWVCKGNEKNFCLFVRHTDDKREWAYDRDSHIGHFDKGLDEAKEQNWTIVDMKNDWKRIYPFN